MSLTGTFFQPFINGFNQFTTRLNPFAPQQQQPQGRPPVPPQQFQNFNAVPVQSQPQPPQQPTGSQFQQPGQNLRQNFQTIRFPSGQVVTQNQQFGVISNTNPTLQQQLGFNAPPFSSQPPAPPSQQPRPQQPQFANFDSQFSQPPQQQQRFPPSQDAGLSSGFSLGQSTSALSQSFRPLSPTNQGPPQQPRAPPALQLDDQQIAQTADQSLDFSRPPEQFRSTTFAPQFDNGIQQDLINGARVRLRPFSTTVGSVGSSESQTSDVQVSSLSRRPVSRVRSRPTTPTPAGRLPVRDRVPVRELPRNPAVPRERIPSDDVASSTQSPLATLQEFVRGASHESPTPPPIISRVRGRPIVPEDFPGPSQAVRGAVPDDEQDERQLAEPSRGSFSNPRERGASGSGTTRATSSGGRSRNRIRIVPTGNRARQPVTRAPVKEEKTTIDELKERPRASGNTRGSIRSNRLPFTATDLDDKEEVDVNDLLDSKPSRRLRPATRFTSNTQPRRKLRPFTTEEPATEKNLISLIPTVPARNRNPVNPNDAKTSKPKPIQSTTSIANLLSTDDFDLAAVVEALRQNSREAFDLDILNAQVKAVEHEEQLALTGSGRPPKFSSPTNSIPFDDEDEESNIIPFADVPSDDDVSNSPEELDGSAITVINLQKDRARQNFKGFVDTDLIDDSLRKSTARPPFVPTISPQFRVKPTSSNVIKSKATTTTTQAPSSSFAKTTTSRPSSSSSHRFLPTSLPPLRENERTTTRTQTTTRRSTVTSSVSSTSKEPVKQEEPKVSVSVSTSLSSTSSSSSSSSSSQARIHDELDKLQSALDPWALINNKEKTKATTESTTRLSLFKIRTLPTKRTTTTTTVRPRSLADLFKIRNGQKITKEEEVPEQVRKSPLNNSSRNNNSNTNRGDKQSTIQKLKNRLDKFRPKKASTTKPPATTTTTTSSTKSSSFQKQKKRPKTVKDILGK